VRVEPIKKEKDIEKVKRYTKKLEDKRIYILFMIGINTGLRISDIVPLKVKDVYKQPYIELKQKKNRQYNKLFINDSLREALNEYCKGKKRNDYLFPSQKGNHIKEDRAYVLLKGVFKKCRLRYNTGTHTLRKTCGYHTNKKSGLEVTQKILDHDSPKDTLRYVGLEQEEMDMALKGLNL
jgi:integrase